MYKVSICCSFYLKETSCTPRNVLLTTKNPPKYLKEVIHTLSCFLYFYHIHMEVKVLEKQAFQLGGHAIFPTTSFALQCMSIFFLFWKKITLCTLSEKKLCWWWSFSKAPGDSSVMDQKPKFYGRNRRFKTYGYGGPSLRPILLPKVLFVVFLVFFPKWRLKCKLLSTFYLVTRQTNADCQ